MAFRLKSKDRSVETALRRIAGEQIDKAIEAIAAHDAAAAVHDVRKRCKKLRGLIRLVRPAFRGYSNENAFFRDTARLIAGARDAKVMEDTFDALLHRYRDQVDRAALETVRRRLSLEREAEAGDRSAAEKLAEVRARLENARGRVARWQLDETGWKAVEKGLTKIYGRAREAASEARTCPDGEIFHDLRKYIKYHWYHCRLLENLWPAMMRVRQEAARDLSEILGDHHDLTVFEQRLSAKPENYGQSRDVEVVIGLARTHRQALEDAAWPAIGRLLGQGPAAMAQQFEALWDVWEDGGRRIPVSG